MDTTTVIALLLIGLLAGTLSGLVGIGGGIVIVPCLVLFLGYTQHQAQGISLGLLLLPVGILAVLNFYKAGYIDFRVIAIMCLAFVAGGYLGSKLALSLPQEVVKKIFAVVLFYTAIRMMGCDVGIIRWVKGIFH
ncbi:MAG: permease [Chitinophagaceae bacterium]